MTLAPAPPQFPPMLVAPADPEREYVAGSDSAYAAYRNTARRLPAPIDDVTRDFGADLYERMLGDSQANAATTILRAAMVEDGAVISTAVQDKTADGYDLAAEICAFCTQVLDDLETPLNDVLWDYSAALAVGNIVGEQIYTQAAGKLVLQKLKVKPRATTAFVVDPYFNLIGLVAVRPDQWQSIGETGTLVYTGTEAPPNLLPRDKFAIWSFRPHAHDPRGTSILRPAYNAWWLKQQTWPEYLKYLAQFASPSLIGIVAPNAQNIDELTPQGLPTGNVISPTAQMGAALAQFRGGTYIVVAHGADVKWIEMKGSGAAFHSAIGMYNREMLLAITTQTLATGEGERSSRAQAGIHQDALDTIVRQGKQGLSSMIRRDILRPLVRYNYGDAALPLVPRATLGTLEAPDISKMWQALAALSGSAYLDDSQKPALDVQVGLPPRTITTAPAHPVPPDSGPQPPTTSPSPQDTVPVTAPTDTGGTA